MKRWFWSIVHNCIVHPIIPFTFGRLGEFLDYLHDQTAKRAFDPDDEEIWDEPHEDNGCEGSENDLGLEAGQFAIKLGTYDLEIKNGYLFFIKRLGENKPFGRLPPIREEKGYVHIANRLKDLDSKADILG